MRVFLPIFLVGLFLSIFFMGQNEIGQQPSIVKSTDGYGISVYTDKSIYSPGDPIQMFLVLFNFSSQSRTFTFKDSQRYDFIVKNSDGEEVYRWSKDKVFGQVVGDETIGPNRKTMRFLADFSMQLPPDHYEVTGKLMARNKPLSATVDIWVRQ